MCCEQVCTDGLELESDMSALEAQLRGFGSELDHFLLGDKKEEKWEGGKGGEEGRKGGGQRAAYTHTKHMAYQRTDSDLQTISTAYCCEENSRRVRRWKTNEEEERRRNLVTIASWQACAVACLAAFCSFWLLPGKLADVLLLTGWWLTWRLTYVYKYTCTTQPDGEGADWTSEWRT